MEHTWIKKEWWRTVKRSAVFLCLFLAMVPLLTGCWNRRELNELAISVGMGIDKEGEQYRLSVQVVNPGEVASKKGGTGRYAPAILYSEKADTVMEAGRKLSQISPRRIYYSHLRMLVIGETLAKDGMAEVLDFLARDHEFRSDFYVVVAKGSSARDTLKIMTSLEAVPANKLFSSLVASEKSWGPTMAVTLDELTAAITSEGKHPVLTGLQIAGDKNIGKSAKNVEVIELPGQLKYSGLAVFKGDKLIGWLNEDESKGYTFILDKVKSSVGHVACPGGGKIGMEIVRSQTKIRGKLVNGQPQVDINLRIEGNVADVECRTIDLTKPDVIYGLEKKAEERIKELIETSIKKAQKSYKVDIFGFGEAIHRASPKAWKTMKKDWDRQYFTDMQANIHVDFKLRRLGQSSNSFQNEIKE